MAGRVEVWTPHKGRTRSAPVQQRPKPSATLTRVVQSFKHYFKAESERETRREVSGRGSGRRSG